MPTSPPDPTGRPSGAKRAATPGSPPPQPGAGAAGGPAPPLPPGKGSTNTHHAAPESLSDLLRGSGSSRRPSHGSDILHALGAPGSSPVVTPGVPAPGSGAGNTDDAPTIITQNRSPSPPAPLVVTGDAPSVAGRRLGHYELIEAVGSGGMAAVLKARDLELGRIVALKILPPEAARDAESVTRFKQEARAAAKLDHENVARVYSCGEDQGLHFIAFEFVEGDNLRVLIDRRGTIPPAECIRYMIQVAAGLNHAAERGVVHRDIKPSNIVVTPDGRAKIVDMGLARHLDAGSVNGGVTQSGVTLGTFDYISPEQALDPRTADVRSDIYSLGCAFYHALTGRPPVPEGTAAKKLHAHQHVPPLDPRQLNPAIPDDLAAILSGMMAKDPAERYQTPAELIAHLKGVAARLRMADEVTADSAVRAVPADQRVLPEPPKLRLGWVLAAAAVAVAVAAFAASTGNPDPRPRGDSGRKPDEPFDPVAGRTPGTFSPAADGVVRTPQELADKLADPATTRVQFGPGVFDLNELRTGVAFSGTELELIGAPDGSTRLAVTAAGRRDQPGALTLKAEGLVAVRGVRFDLRPVPAGEFGTGPAAPVRSSWLVVQAARAEFTDCVFGSFTPAGVESVALDVAGPATTPDADPPPRVRLTRCAFAPNPFAPGWVGVRVPAGAEVAVDDCGFGPHAAAIQVAGNDQPGGTPASLALARSSFLLGPSSAAVEARSPVAVAAGYCVFGPIPAPPATPADGRALVLRAVGGTAGMSLASQPGQKNVYYRVDPLAVVTDEETRGYTFDQCRAAEKAANLPFDAAAVVLSQRPWAEPDPPAVLAGADPWRAFGLKLTDPLVFTKDTVKVVGARFQTPLGMRAYPDLSHSGFPPPPKEPAATTDARTLVWQPDAKDDPLPKDTYTDLVILLRNARSGDTVLVRHDGPVPVERTELKPRGTADPAGFRLTFKPFPGSSPVLTTAGGRDSNQTLFQIPTGHVVFEGLQFRLAPPRPRFAQRVAVAAVQLVGAEGCTFSRCAFTLAEDDDGRAAVVVIDDPDRGVMMGTDAGTRPPPDAAPRPVPRVKFDRCLVRGKGRGVWVPVSRPVEVEAVHTLTALDGPLFLAEQRGKATPAAQSVLTLRRVTALAGGPLVELHGGKVGEMRASGLVPLEVRADECLFAAVPSAGRPLVEFNDIDPAEVKALLEWKVRDANRYANFPAGAAVMSVRPGGDAAGKDWNLTEWQGFAGEPAGADKRAGTVTFDGFPTAPVLKDLPTIRPADAVVKAADFPDLTPGTKPADAGAESKDLPVPTDDEPRPE